MDLFLLAIFWYGLVWVGECITTGAIKRRSMLLYFLRLQMVQFALFFVSQTTQNGNQCARINTIHPHHSIHSRYMRHCHLSSCGKNHFQWNWNLPPFVQWMKMKCRLFIGKKDGEKKNTHTSRIGQVQEKVYILFPVRKYFSIHISGRVFFSFCCCVALLDVNLFLLLHRTIT